MRSPPAVSVVVPVYNDPSGLRDTLASLANQRNASELEVLIVDNGSTDETTTVIDDFESEFPELISGYAEKDIQSSYAARNRGIERATGDIIAFLDADVTVGETWFLDVVRIFRDSDVDYLGCDVEMYVPDDAQTLWAGYDASMGLPVKHYLATKHFAPTCALVVRREVFDAVGSFDESLVSGGDKEFGTRVWETGFTMGYTDEITVRHPTRTTFRSHVKKAVRIGRGQAQLWRSHDLGGNPLSPTRLLPPDPRRVRGRLKNGSGFALIYLFEFLLKLVQTASAVAETKKQFNSET